MRTSQLGFKDVVGTKNGDEGGGEGGEVWVKRHGTETA